MHLLQAADLRDHRSLMPLSQVSCTLPAERSTHHSVRAVMRPRDGQWLRRWERYRRPLCARLISPLRRSIGLVECSFARCSFGKSCRRASSSASSVMAAFGKASGVSRSATLRHCGRRLLFALYGARDCSHKKRLQKNCPRLLLLNTFDVRAITMHPWGLFPQPQGRSPDLCARFLFKLGSHQALIISHGGERTSPTSKSIHNHSLIGATNEVGMA